MIKENIQAEWLKDKRSANRKMLFLVPLIFMVFCFLLTLMMGYQSNGQSWLSAAAFNWYPLMILPTILALMVGNSFSKEKQQQKNLYESHDFSIKAMTLGKVAVVTFQLSIILIFSGFLYCFLAYVVYQDQQSLLEIVTTFFALFCGTLPVLALSFLLLLVVGRIPMLLVTFIFSIAGATTAIKSWWFLFPWGYNLRMMAALVRVHPNGTYITDSSSPLLNSSNFWIGCLLSLAIFLLVTFVNCQISDQWGREK